MKPITYVITPVGKPRMTRRDVWMRRACVMRYRAFKDEIKRSGLSLPASGARVRFVLPMPASWSQRKQLSMAGMPHQQTPDLDNILKSLLDALFESDAEIHDIHISKRWGYAGAISVETADGG